MRILAIESSCDETAAAIVEDGRVVLANVISSQIFLHNKTGGVVPEIAAREHVKYILPVVHEAFAESSTRTGEKIGWDDIDAIAVTRMPGLVGSVMVGRMCASTLSFLYDKPLFEVNHIHGHIYSNWLLGPDSVDDKDRDLNKELPEFPVITLTVSGGHNELYLLKDYKDIEMIGKSIDDASGEAFDKCARMLGLSYPGGPAIEKSAKDFDENLRSSEKAVGRLFPRAQIDAYNFSFSGLKTSVLYYIQKHEELRGKSSFVSEIAFEFQTAVVDALSKKLMKAVKDFGVKEVHLAGGVSANKALRKKIQEELTKLDPNIKLRWPAAMSYCTDNAAMIAAVAYWKHLQKNS